ncbi:MAG: sulfotransferase domain-containing protein [Terriglobia bacterium]
MGRSLNTYPDDVFLVSYPKSGNTWLRFLIGNLAHPETEVSFANIESIVPSIYVNHERSLSRLPRPRILKSHESFVPWYGRIIYAVRDPRDICVSYYHYQIKYRELPEHGSLERFVPQFLRGEIDRQYGHWGDHVMSWLAMRKESPNFIVLRYEDLLANPQAELARVASLLRIPTTPESLERAISLSSADRMRELEKLQSHLWISTRKSRQDLPFVRSARAGDWKEALAPRWVFQIEAAWGKAMQLLGYELTSCSTESSKEDLTARCAPRTVGAPAGRAGR